MVLWLAADPLDVEDGALTVLILSYLDGPILKVILSLLVAWGVEMEVYLSYCIDGFGRVTAAFS